MRYVSEIIAHPEGQVDKMKYDMWVTEPKYTAKLVDLETGAEELVDGKSVMGMSDILGFSDRALPAKHVVLTHNPKSALIYRFIEEAHSYPLGGGVSYDHADVCVQYADGLTDHTGVSGGNRNLVVNTIIESIRVFGKLGSVVVREANFSGVWSTHTLYEALGMLCRETRLNLMSYETVQFYNQAQEYHTYIRFRHNADADRFFTKMYFDVCGGKL